MLNTNINTNDNILSFRIISKYTGLSGKSLYMKSGKNITAEWQCHVMHTAISAIITILKSVWTLIVG